jgi:hypothetical protein
MALVSAGPPVRPCGSFNGLHSKKQNLSSNFKETNGELRGLVDAEPLNAMIRETRFTMKYTTVTLLATLLITHTASAEATMKKEENIPKNARAAQASEQIMLQFTILEIDAAGKETVLSRPSLFTAEGLEGAIRCGEENGKDMKIKVTPFSVAAVKQM